MKFLQLIEIAKEIWMIIIALAGTIIIVAFSSVRDRLKIYWNKLEYYITELISMWSNQDSFFSKKRIESAVAFCIAEWGMITWLQCRISTISMEDFKYWAGGQFIIAGYTVWQIQSEKKLNLGDGKDKPADVPEKTS